MDNLFEKKMIELFEKEKINLDEEKIKLFKMYKENLIEWNEKINLTSIIDDDGIIIKHFIDSLTCSKYIKPNNRIIDVGTGAGFPGIPLKIFLGDELNITLMDSLNKRIIFLQDVANKLEMKNIDLIHGRAEELGKDKKYREQFDICTSRAVANLKVLSEYCLPFVKVNGYFISMKGSDYEEEVNDAKEIIDKLGGKIEKIEKINLPTDINHTIILIKKMKNTPSNFPRKQAQIKK